MNREELAGKLNGAVAGSELRRGVEEAIKIAGLVVAYGESDDNWAQNRARHAVAKAKGDL